MLEDVITTSEKRHGQVAIIEFLPSSFGRGGYRAYIFGWRGVHDPVDGWSEYDYVHFAGVAHLPSTETLEADAWLRTVVARLRQQGVLFLNKAQSEQYLKGEGLYWRWRFRLERPTLFQRVVWTLKKPATPFSTVAATLANAFNSEMVHQVISATGVLK